MAIEEISRIPVGDMILRYEQETDYATAGFSVIPADMDGQDNAEKFYRINSLVQMKLVGDMDTVRPCVTANLPTGWIIRVR